MKKLNLFITLPALLLIFLITFINIVSAEDCLEKLFEIMYSKNVGCYTKALEWKKNEK